jgi:hypothetical protein
VIPGQIGLFLLQALQIDDDFYRPLIHWAQVHQGIGGVLGAACGAFQAQHHDLYFLSLKGFCIQGFFVFRVFVVQATSGACSLI